MIDNELNACSWHTDKTDKNDHILAYQYDFKDGKVDVSYLDITNASAPQMSSMVNTESLDIQKAGTFDYEITKDAIIIKSDPEESIPYVYEDNKLTINDGKYFTTEQIKTKLKGTWEWNYKTALAGITVTLTMDKKYDGNGKFTYTIIGTGVQSTAQTNTGTYEPYNGYIVEKGDNGESRCYFYSYDGNDVTFQNVDLFRKE